MARTSPRIFVVQEHDATSHHYDFRLEIDGVLKSWSIPKGPSLDPAVRRLAIMTEDHAMEYADFEGVLPEGSYGAGPVIVWDRGVFENRTERDGRTIPAGRACRDGHLVFVLQGVKLVGTFSLFRTRVDRGKQMWLLQRRRDAAPTPTTDWSEASVLTGRTIEDVRAEG